MRRISPGARPGDEPDAIERPRADASVTFGQHNASAFPSRDAASLKDARADADRAYGEMVARHLAMRGRER